MMLEGYDPNDLWFRCLDQDLQPCNGGAKGTKYLEVGMTSDKIYDIELCVNGWHITKMPWLWLRKRVQVVLPVGVVIGDTLKSVCAQYRVLAEIDSENIFDVRIAPWLAPKALAGANLARAELDYAYLSYADLSGADLENAHLFRADLLWANLSGANLREALLYGANLGFANLSGANLSGANFTGASLYQANLSGANLSGANFTGANLSYTNLRYAELRDADASFGGAIWVRK